MKKKNPTVTYPICPQCKVNEHVVKNGYVRGKQQWRCQNCKCDFFQQKTLRKPKFEYWDLKILAVFLLYAGFTAEGIFNNLIKLKSDDIKTAKVIYQWSKQIQKIIQDDICKTFEYDCKLYPIKNFKEFNTAKDDFLKTFECSINHANLVYFKIDSTLLQSNISMTSNGIIPKQKLEPDVLLQLFFAAMGYNSEKMTTQFEDSQSVNYDYRDYFSKLNEKPYTDIKDIEKPETFYQSKNVAHYFVYFDYNKVNIAIIYRKKKDDTSVGDYKPEIKKSRSRTNLYFKKNRKYDMLLDVQKNIF